MNQLEDKLMACLARIKSATSDTVVRTADASKEFTKYLRLDREYQKKHGEKFNPVKYVQGVVND